MAVGADCGERMVGRIPVRNLWLLMLYASELTRYKVIQRARGRGQRGPARHCGATTYEGR